VGGIKEAPVTTCGKPVVRLATLDDLDAMVNVDLRAFADVYGSPPDPMTVTSVRARYADLLGLIGSWCRVLETASGEVVGLNQCFPIGLSRAELVERFEQGLDTTDIDVIRSLFDPTGTAMYGLNLAVLGGHVGSGSLYLNAGMWAMTRARGIRHVYFRSRLAGFARWLAERCPDIDPEELPKVSRDALAERYCRSTVRRGGVDRPADPLLAMHIDAGCKPLSLVSGWPLDRPALGYSVLCERALGHEQAT
jgi:hypothetical protein